MRAGRKTLDQRVRRGKRQHFGRGFTDCAEEAQAQAARRSVFCAGGGIRRVLVSGRRAHRALEGVGSHVLARYLPFASTSAERLRQSVRL